MAQPVTPQDHIAAATKRVRDQQQAMLDLAAELAASSSSSQQANRVEPPAGAGG